MQFNTKLELENDENKENKENKELIEMNKDENLSSLTTINKEATQSSIDVGQVYDISLFSGEEVKIVDKISIENLSFSNDYVTKDEITPTLFQNFEVKLVKLEKNNNSNNTIPITIIVIVLIFLISILIKGAFKNENTY